jgi:hypothetical protein
MYRQHVEDQTSLIEEELFHLCEGLPLLPNLEQISIRDWWTWEYGPYEEGSYNAKVPLSRGWNDLWLEPDTWLGGYNLDYHPQNPRQQGFLTLMRALSITGKTIQSFVIHPNDTAWGMSCRIFDLRSREFTHSLNVFRNLHKLVLYLDVDGFRDVNARGNSLAKLLSAAVNLEDLTLGLSQGYNEDYADFGELFGVAIWPRLHSVNLQGIAIHKKQLLSFLRRHNSRNLKDVSLAFLYLRSGLWVEVVEDMQSSLSLNGVDMSALHDSGEVGYYELNGFGGGYFEDGEVSREKLQIFILHGGENPLRRFTSADRPAYLVTPTF